MFFAEIWPSFIDSTFIIDSIPYKSNGMDKFNLPKTIMRDSSLIIVYHYKGTEGVFVEKINTNSGKVDWNYYFDHRSDNRFETYSYFYLNEDDNFEILSFREKFEYKSVYKTFSKKVLDYNDGEILEHVYGDDKDTLVEQLIWSEIWNRSYLFPYEEGKYQYVSTEYKNLNNDTISIYNYLLNENGQAFEKTYLNIEKEFPYTNFFKMELIGEDSILSFSSNYNSFDEDSDTFILKYHMDIFDREMNIISSNELADLVYDSGKTLGLRFPYKDKNLFIVEHLSNKEFVYYFYNYQGEVVGRYPVMLEDSMKLQYNSVTKLSDGSFLVCGTTYDYFNEGSTSELCFIRIDLENDEIKLLKKIKVTPEDNFLNVQYIYELENGDFVIGGRHSFHTYKDGKPKSGSSGSGYGQTTLYIKAENIGLKTSISQMAKLGFSFDLFPNPASSIIDIKFPNDVSGVIEIIDALGRKVKRIQIINKNKIEFNISNLSSGIYNVRFIDPKNRVNSKVFIKE